MNEAIYKRIREHLFVVGNALGRDFEESVRICKDMADAETLAKSEGFTGEDLVLELLSVLSLELEPLSTKVEN